MNIVPSCRDIESGAINLSNISISFQSHCAFSVIGRMESALFYHFTKRLHFIVSTMEISYSGLTNHGSNSSITN